MYACRKATLHPGNAPLITRLHGLNHLALPTSVKPKKLYLSVGINGVRVGYLCTYDNLLVGGNHAVRRSVSCHSLKNVYGDMDGHQVQ